MGARVAALERLLSQNGASTPTDASSTLPPIVDAIRNVSHSAAWRGLAAFHSSSTPFRIHLDASCALPSDWQNHWAAPPQWGSLGDGNWATKYAAAGFIPKMISSSPFFTHDWRKANASVVVLIPRHFAGGPTILQQQCLLRLQQRSPAWRATNGSRHFFIFVDSRGPCSLDGKYKDVGFRRHHVIGPHGEPASSKPWFRLGSGPPLACFDAQKDIGIPTPNIHFPRTPFAKPLPPVPAGGGGGARPLLLFYAGWNYDTRMRLVKLFSNDSDPAVLVRRSVPPADYAGHMLRSRFCPVCGGFSQWTPRLAEALYYGCVPIILSDALLPAFSEILDWSTFSARLPARRVGDLKTFAASLDHAALAAGVRAARGALMYRLDGYRGDDLLPLLVYEIARKAAAAVVPQPPVVRELWNTVDADRDYDEGAEKSSHLNRDVGVERPAVGGGHVEAHAGLEILGGETGRAGRRSGVAREHAQRWMCSTFNGYDCRCEKLDREQTVTLLQIVDAEGAAAWGGDGAALKAAWGRVIQAVRAKPRIFGALMHGPAAFLKSGRAVKANLEQLVQLPAARLNVSRGQAEVAGLAVKIRAHRAMALGLPVGV